MLFVWSALAKTEEDESPPPTVLTPYERGVQALKQKDAITAITEFSACVQTQKKNIFCHWELGWAYFLNHDYAKALSQWKGLKKIKKRSWPDLDKAIERARLHTELLKKAHQLKKRTGLASFNPRQKSELIKIRAVGDMMLGTNFPTPNLLPPEEVFLLKNVKELLNGADIVFANYEGTICEGGTSIKCEESEEGACYAFRTPPRLAEQLKQAGFNAISLANNHIFDFGEECRKQTEQTLDRLGIPWSGRPGTVARFERQGVPISLIAFHSAEHSNSTLDLDTASELIQAEKEAKRIVIVSFHGGAEGFKAHHVPNKTEKYFNEDRGHVRQFARGVIKAGADMVLGSGPHVVRGIEIYKGRLIAYSLGNFATYRTFNLWGTNGVSLILEIDIDTQGRFIAGKIIPLKQRGFGIPEYDAHAFAVDIIRLLSREDFPTTRAFVARDGTLGTPQQAYKLFRTAEAQRKR